MAKRKKSKAGLIVVSILLVAVIAVGAYFGLSVFKKRNAAYDQAVTMKDAGNYYDAYYEFMNLGSFKDAAQQADALDQMMKEAAADVRQKAQKVADLGFYSLAGLYLTELLENEAQFYVEDFNALAATVGDYYAAAEEGYMAVMSKDEKMAIIAMQEFMDRIEALEESNDPAEALDILAGVTSPPLAEQLIENCINRNTFADTSLAEMAHTAPYWVPLMDQYFASTAGFDFMGLIERL